jgi:RNA polymerase sigma-70 factor (ECF subfamily)
MAASARVFDLTDELLIARVIEGDTRAFGGLVQRYNQRLYRVVRAIVSDDAAAEDALQQAYFAAWKGLHTFDGRAQLATWLARVAIRQALADKGRRRRATPRHDDLEPPPSYQAPDDAAIHRQHVARLEHAVDALPEAQRLVLILRDVEGLTTAETAEALDLSQENVRVRLHRARALLRRALGSAADLRDVHTFAGARCARMLTAVLACLGDGRAAESAARPPATCARSAP